MSRLRKEMVGTGDHSLYLKKYHSSESTDLSTTSYIPLEKTSVSFLALGWLPGGGTLCKQTTTRVCLSSVTQRPCSHVSGGGGYHTGDLEYVIKQIKVTHATQKTTIFIRLRFLRLLLLSVGMRGFGPVQFTPHPWWSRINMGYVGVQWDILYKNYPKRLRLGKTCWESVSLMPRSFRFEVCLLRFCV